MKKEVKNWLDSATYDLESAEFQPDIQKISAHSRKAMVRRLLKII